MRSQGFFCFSDPQTLNMGGLKHFFHQNWTLWDNLQWNYQMRFVVELRWGVGGGGAASSLPNPASLSLAVGLQQILSLIWPWLVLILETEKKDLTRLLWKVNEWILKERISPNTAGVLTASFPLLGSFFCASSSYKTEIHSAYCQRCY